MLVIYRWMREKHGGERRALLAQAALLAEGGRS